MSDKMNSFKNKFIPSKDDSKKVLIYKIEMIIGVLVFIAAVCILIPIAADSIRTKRDQERLQEIHTSVVTQIITEATTVPTETVTETTVTTTEPPPLVLLENMAPFVEQNSDTAGWLTVGGTSIDNVVLQTDNNDYYLENSFYKNRSQAGAIFADFRCIVNDYNNKQSDNIILYGHNQRDGTMFGTLKKYKVTHQNTNNFQFYLNHPTFTFSNLYEEYVYKIVALFIIEVNPEQNRDGVIFDYHNYLRFSKSKRPFDIYKENVLARTAINTGVDFEEGDKLMTLSTCSNEFEPSRFVVIGRRVRDGEDPSVDTSLAELNYDAVEPDLDYIYSR